jgi:uridylate kinase
MPSTDSPAASHPNLHYKRILLKISGEALGGEGGFGIDPLELESIANECLQVAQTGVQLSIVVGGGNFIRGATFSTKGHIPRATADYMGMLGTVLNAVALQEMLEKLGQATRVLSAIPIEKVCEPFIRRRAIRHMEKGRVVIFAAGTGNPFFTTDTGAAQRAVEIGAEVILKATKVDGVYSADPKKDPNAKFLSEVSFDRVLSEQLKVMDMTAFAMCREHNLPVVIFNMRTPGCIQRIISGEKVGTRIQP